LRVLGWLLLGFAIATLFNVSSGIGFLVGREILSSIGLGLLLIVLAESLPK
jgi:hypothetical protein